MRRWLASASAALALVAAASDASAETGRFDAQTFRPSAAPRDLVMVRKSEIIGHVSPVVGLFSDLSFDPLILLDKSTNDTIDVVSTRLTLTAMAGIGLWNWIDFTAALPIIAFQDGGNLRKVGTEGEVKPQALGDLRLEAKLGLPFLHRKDQVKSGFGAALYGNVNLPTGDVMAFAGDGVVTGGGGVILDYRFNFGLLVAANGGVWLRPDRQFASTRVGNMASFGVAAEMYVLQRYGISVMGEVFGYPSMVSFPEDPAQIPAEGLLGIRWQSKWGLTVTVGGSFGAACSFGAPGLRLWSSITFQPKSSREQQEINRLMEKDSLDPDKDGLIGESDHCPQAPGRPENFGCPDTDSDGDGVTDRDDKCPDLASNTRGKDGCPGAYVNGDEIVIMEQVHFATDKDIILDESKPIIEDVAQVMIRYPEISEVVIEGHTDIRAGDAYNKQLSQRRVNSVQRYLEARGIASSRLKAIGYGHSQPEYDDSSCTGPDEQLTPTCRFMTSRNRRVLFKITKRGTPTPQAITGSDQGTMALPPGEKPALPGEKALPSGGNLPPPKSGALPGSDAGTLPKQEPPPSTKPEDKPLPGADEKPLPKDGSMLPSDNPLPKDTPLPKAGLPKKAPDPKKPVAPAPDAPKP